MSLGETIQLMEQFQVSLEENNAELTEVQRNAAEELATALRDVLAGRRAEVNVLYHGRADLAEEDQSVGSNEAQILTILAECRLNGKIHIPLLLNAISLLSSNTRPIKKQLELVQRAIEENEDSIWQLPARARYVRPLLRTGIRTMKDLEDFLRNRGDLAAINEVGDIMAPRIVAALESYRLLTGEMPPDLEVATD
ncbi:hypothetical protein KA012_02245 [Candidatus Woesebacteria bacterium]|nr:hypothetical protein [Candidatus Woesebacteria bacterium]